jgi:hypothetical protein
VSKMSFLNNRVCHGEVFYAFQGDRESLTKRIVIVVQIEDVFMFKVGMC